MAETDNDGSTDGTEHLPLDYDVDKRYAHVRVEVLGKTFTDVVRVCEQFPNLPDGISVYVEHVDAVDLKQENPDKKDYYPRVKGKCPECGSRSLFVGKDGYVTCSVIGCENPSAPSEALGVEFDRDVQLGNE